ncbi:MAG: helix-turn-helix transcriptional regulator [Clostridia bacterium]|nr:helix-turn-helix transcriptional regulator [Clostridia bacterium]
MSIGEKIKTLRKEKGFTQSSLSDGIITRNMLSLIESGSARPSYKAARALAERLGVPVEYLMSDSDSPVIYSNADGLSELRTMFKAGRFEECVKAGAALSGDEASLIIMRASYSLGLDALKERRIAQALEYFTTAGDFSAKTFYALPDEVSKIRRMYLLCDAIVGKKNFSDVPKLSYDEFDETSAYIAALYGVDIGNIELLPEHKTHVLIAKLIKVGRLADAEKALLDRLKVVGDKLTKYYMLRSLEDVYRKRSDFKGTLETSEKRKAAFEELI